MARWVLLLGTVALLVVGGVGLWNDIRMDERVEDATADLTDCKRSERFFPQGCAPLEDRPDEARDERQAYRLWFGFAALATVLLTVVLAVALARSDRARASV